MAPNCGDWSFQLNPQQFKLKFIYENLMKLNSRPSRTGRLINSKEHSERNLISDSSSTSRYMQMSTQDPCFTQRNEIIWNERNHFCVWRHSGLFIEDASAQKNETFHRHCSECNGQADSSRQLPRCLPFKTFFFRQKDAASLFRTRKRK